MLEAGVCPNRKLRRSTSGLIRGRPKSPTAIPKSNVFSPSYASTAILCCTVVAFWKRFPIGIILTLVVFCATGKKVLSEPRIAGE